MRALVVLLATLLLALPAVADPAEHVRPYPVWKQTDPSWAEQPLTGAKGTIGQLGCAVTAVAMQLRGLGRTLDGKPIDPAVLNAAIHELHVWNMAATVGLHVRNVTGRLDEALARNAVVVQIQYVAPSSLGGGVAPHFVLATHKDNLGRIVVHDPLRGRRTLEKDEPLDTIQNAYELY